MTALGFIFATTSVPPGKWPAFGIMVGLVWLAAALSGVGLGRVFLRSLIALPFIMIALPTVFTKPGDPLFDVSFGLFTLTATVDGMEFFASVLIKSWASVTAAVVLTSTTPAFQLLAALRALKIPQILVVVVMLMYRYLFVLVDEAQRMLRSRAARSAGGGRGAGGSIVWRARSAGGMAGSLFIRTMDRTERIYMAMLARGYDGTIRQRETLPVSGHAVAATVLALVLFASVAVSARVLM